MNAIISALLWCVVQVTVLGIGATLVYLTARRFHPRAGAVAIGGALGIVLLLTALVASPWPRWSFSTYEGQFAQAEPAAPRATPVVSAEGDVAVTEKASTSTALPPGELESPRIAFWTALVDGLNNPRGAVDAKPQAAWWRRVIGLVFVVGAFIAAGRLAWGVVLVRRLARRAVAIDDPRLRGIVRELQAKLELTGPIALCESNELATPATVGWRRPVVLLPPSWRNWTNDELRAAIAHELAHIAGRDYAAWLVARLAVVAHFYHPLVRWLARRLQLEQELAADLAAARLVGDNRQYLHSLAALALATPPHRVAGPVRTLIPSRSLLVRRIDMLRTSEMNRPRRNVVRYATFGVVALLGVAAAGLRGSGMTAEEGKPVDTEKDIQWSEAVNGLRARIVLKRTEVLNGTPMISIFLVLQNVSDVANPMKLRLSWGEGSERMKFRVVDTEAKELPVANGPYSGQAHDAVDLVIPFRGELSFDISIRGLGIPGDKRALIPLGPFSSWVIDHDGKDYTFEAVLEIDKSKQKHDGLTWDWHGRIEMPPVQIPLQAEPIDETTVVARIKELGQKMLDKDSRVSEKAQRALSLIDDPRVIPWYLEAMDTDSYSLKFRALDRLSNFDDDDALAGLKKGMNTQTVDFRNTKGSISPQLADNIRHQAAVALSRSPHPEARPLLMSMWNDQSRSVRITVLHVLGKMDTPESLELLKTMSADRDEVVRDEALRYLKLRTAQRDGS